MTERERKKIWQEKLLELILNTPEPSISPLNTDHEQKINMLINGVYGIDKFANFIKYC